MVQKYKPSIHKGFSIIKRECFLKIKLIHLPRTLLLAASLLFANTSAAVTLHGRVVGVADGDTVTVLDATHTQWKIRLMGIDAPEKKQAFGNKSKEALSALIFNKEVAVEFNKQDKYGRTVGKIIVNGVDANLEQVKAGLAWHYKQYEREQSVEDRTKYAQAEEQAREAKRGLWVDQDPTPPWDWRHQQKADSHVAEWTEVGGNDNQTVYADLTSIHKSSNRVTMWSLLDLKEPDTTTGKPYLSMKMQNEFDCEREQYRFLFSLNYSGSMGGGEVVFRNGTAAEWNPIPPTSAAKTLWKVACKKW